MALFAIVSGTLISCQKEEISTNITPPSLEASQEISDEVLYKIQSLYLNPTVVETHTLVQPDGTQSAGIMVEGDQFMTLAQLDEMVVKNAAMATGEGAAKQYRTTNLVRAGSTIRVIGYNGNDGFGLTSTGQTALQWAVNNFNRLNITINFTLDFGTNYQSYDMVVYRQPSNSGAGGSAGFPSGGAPNKLIQIFAGMDRYDTNTVEHVITHEMGHAVGLRHTDYFSRSSCGQNTNEGDAGVGAIQIPGTASGVDPDSIMLSCFSNGEDGEFGAGDIIALEFMY